jgi:hypothetical protein
MTEALEVKDTTAGPTVGSFLDRDAIGAFAVERRTEKIVVNERGDYVYVTEISGDDRNWYEKQSMRNESGRMVQNYDGAIARMLVIGLTDADGKKMYGRNEWQKVQNWKSSLQQRLFDAICDVSGISERARESFLSELEITDSDD